MCLPSQNILSKCSGWGKELRADESDIELNFVLNGLAKYILTISSNSFIIPGSKHFTSDNVVLALLCFLKHSVLGHMEAYFHCRSMLLGGRNMYR